MATDAGQTVTVTVPSEAKVLQLAVGSTDLKTATPSQFSDIAVGDRVLATSKTGDAAGSFNALRVILMKSSAIAQMQAAELADWRARGVGGIVSAVDPATGAITIMSGATKIVVNTTGKTVFRRFVGDSVKYEDTKPGTLAQIQKNDQLQARGAKSADGTSIAAEEVLSGSFKNLSGLIASIDPAARTITLKDLATHKVFTVNVTANSDIRSLPLQMATMFAARSNGGGRGGSGGRGGAGGSAGQADAAGGARRSAGADLSQMMERLPTGTLADLKNDDAVMIVATEPTPGSSTVTAITLLTGVEPILTANPNGGMDLSMSMGGGMGGGEGGE
jgi:co-chaperonin GroES (HSP10)